MFVKTTVNQMHYSYPEIMPPLPRLTADKELTDHLVSAKLSNGDTALCGFMSWENKDEGYIGLLRGEVDFTADDYELLSTSLSICVNEIKLNRDLLSLRHEQIHRLVTSIIQGNIDENEALLLAQNLGYRLPDHYHPILIYIQNGPTKKIVNHLMHTFYSMETIAALLEPQLFIGLCMEKFPLEKWTYIFKDMKRFIHGFEYVAVTGPEVTFAKIPLWFTSIHRGVEAALALEIKDSVCILEDLGVYQLIDRQQDKEIMWQYYYKYIDPLLQNPESGLLTTLQVLSKHCFNYSKTARELYLHSNTIRYRVSVIEKTLHIHVHNPFERLELELALRVYHLLKGWGYI